MSVLRCKFWWPETAECIPKQDSQVPRIDCETQSMKCKCHTLYFSYRNTHALLWRGTNVQYSAVFPTWAWAWLQCCQLSELVSVFSEFLEHSRDVFPKTWLATNLATFFSVIRDFGNYMWKVSFVLQLLSSACSECCRKAQPLSAGQSHSSQTLPAVRAERTVPICVHIENEPREAGCKYNSYSPNHR